MPYRTEKGTGEDKGKTCVYKKDSNEKVGCTDGPIKDYLAALHTNANESKRNNKMALTKAKLIQIIQEEVNNVLKEARRASPPGIKIGDIVDPVDETETWSGNPEDEPLKAGRVTAIEKHFGGLTGIHVLWSQGQRVYTAASLKIKKSR